MQKQEEKKEDVKVIDAEDIKNKESNVNEDKIEKEKKEYKNVFAGTFIAGGGRA